MDSNCDSIGKKPCDDEELGHVTKNLSEPMPQQAVCSFNKALKNLWINGDLFAVLNLPPDKFCQQILKSSQGFLASLQKKKLHLGNYLHCAVFF